MDEDDKHMKQWAEDNQVLLNVIVIGAVLLLIVALTMVLRDEHARGEFVRGSAVDVADPVCDCGCSTQVTEEDQQ